MDKSLSHLNEQGKANMVDVTAKKPMKRTAIAAGFIRLQPETIKLIENNLNKKGDVLSIAEIAGIQGGKQTASLIPLCHPLNVGKITVKTEIQEHGILVHSEAVCIGQTGIEMEALTAVSVALLTIYDMCKAVDKAMIVENIHLVEKKKEPIELI